MSDLPRGWVEARLDELGSWQGGGTPDKSNAAYWTGGSIPWVSPKDMKRFHISEAEDQITEAALAGSSANLVAGNSVLLVTRSGILKHTLPVALTGRDVAINQDIKALTPHPELDPLFIAQQIKSLGPFVLKNCTKAGTTVDSVDFERLKAVPANIPSLAEQKRIVAKLDALNAKSARARTELARIETLVSRYKQAVLSKAFSGEYGGLTEQKRLGDATHILSGYAFSSADYVRTGIALVRIGDIVNGVVALNDGTKRLPAEYLEIYRRFVLQHGDICIALSGATTGKLGVFTASEPALLNQRVAVLRSQFHDDQRYVAPFAQFVSDQMLAAAYGGAQPNISPKWLADQMIPWPSSEQRHSIRNRIESAFAKIDRLAKEAKRALALVGRLDEAILAKAFRGELVPQDENDEPAEHLLARIRAERETAPKVRRGRGRT